LIKKIDRSVTNVNLEGPDNVSAIAALATAEQASL
jgi:hypothetical protein